MATEVLNWSTSVLAASPAILLQGRINITLSGTFTGLAAVLVRCFDEAATWVTCSSLGASLVFTAAASEVCEEPEAGVPNRVNVTPFGIRPLAVLLITYQDRHGLRTIEGIISCWAPAHGELEVGTSGLAAPPV